MVLHFLCRLVGGGSGLYKKRQRYRRSDYDAVATPAVLQHLTQLIKE